MKSILQRTFLQAVSRAPGWILLAAMSPALARAEADAKAPRMFFEERCYDCHDATEKKGGLDLDALKTNFADADNFALWVKVHDRVAAGEMPPKKKARPPAAESAAFLGALAKELTLAEASKSAGGGRSTVRRMNRVEYENALRDLLALPLLRVKEMLPEDGQQFGFDKVAGALDISHVQMTKYLQAADVALRQAVVPAVARPETKTWREPAMQQDSAQAAIAQKCCVPLHGRELASGLTSFVAGNPVEDYGNSYRAASFSGVAESCALLTGVIGAHQPEGLQIDRFRPTVAGWYRVRFSIWSLRWERTHAGAAVRGQVRAYTSLGPPYFKDAHGHWQATPLPPEQLAAQNKPGGGDWRENVEFYGEGEATHIVRASLKGEPLGYFDAPSLKPKTHEFKVWLNPGERVSFHAMTLPASAAPSGGPSDGILDYEGPGVAYDWFEVEGPLVEQWPPESQRRLFGAQPADAKPTRTDHRGLLLSFATRAFRRPVADDELTPYEAIVEAQLQRGTSFEQAMLAGYKGILCAPDFLFIGLESGVPQPAKTGAARLGDYALASRLSFFFWNSLPDAALLELAAQHTLAQPAILQAQVERMLEDTRSERFVEHFTDEWLELKKIDFTTPDPMLYPEYDPWLHDSMLAETRASFRRLLTQNLGVREVIASDTIFINQRLAELYGIRGVNGAELREMKVPAGSPRGGFLTQASVLKVTANGTATSPVLRGVWVMERILGIPRLPPPPNIPTVEPDATGAVTIRQMIEKHRADAACASCHAKMDPPGMALENFDVIGGWRDRYRLAGTPGKIRKGTEEVAEPTVEVVSATASYFHRVKMRLGSEVDATGELADGRKFADVNGLRTLLLADEDALARNLARQLLIYATGAGIRFSDRPGIEAIIVKTKPTHHGLRSLVQEVVASELFQSK